MRPGDPVGRYLQALALAAAERFAAAAGALEELLAAGYRDWTVYLTLADLYQYRLEEPRQAIASLEEALRRRKDPEVRRRLEELRREAGAEADPAGEP